MFGCTKYCRLELDKLAIPMLCLDSILWKFQDALKVHALRHELSWQSSREEHITGRSRPDGEPTIHDGDGATPASVMGQARAGAAPRVRETPTAARSRAEWVHASEHESETMVGRLAVIHLLEVERSPLTLRRALSAARAAGVKRGRRGATGGGHRARRERSPWRRASSAAGEEPLAAGAGSEVVGNRGRRAFLFSGQTKR